MAWRCWLRLLYEMDLDRKVFDVRLGCMLVVTLAEPHGVGMSASVETDMIFPCQAPIGVGRYAIQVSKWWHSARHSVGKQIFEFGFAL